ncbi:MAG: DUF1549 and DUF1553 domain-containing protein, partial [Phycisphaerae bacterium]|nr:DUF1549 and DUF1553 domain-containing protein [Phycisphaerae bacterium]
LLRGGHTGVSVVPGDPARGLLLPLLRHEEDPPMPHKADKLPADQIAKIAKWIELGAPYDRPLVDRRAAPLPSRAQVTEEDRRFWSFLPLRNVAPPDVRNASWVRTPVDRFILARLEENGLVPNGPADKRKLIRRAYLDLLGLPPDPQAVEAFVNDKSPDAYPRLIDQLLENPHYGERWARHWMDVARFAESHGYEQDYDRKHAYHYRDFLIRAFNADMPYDRFIRWQIAGDEMAPDDPLAMMATGFLGAGAFPTQLTEMEFESARYDELDDMTATTGSAFLGLSVGCARCHDHKFDPIPSADYYRLASTFTTTIRSEIDLDISPADNKQVDEQQRKKLVALEADLKRFEGEKLPGMFQAYVRSLKHGNLAVAWQVLAIREARSQHGTQLKPQGDQSILASGPRPNQDAYTLVADTDLVGITAVRIEALTHASFPRRGPGRAGNGNFVLGDIRVTAQPRDGGQAAPVKLVGAEATHQQDTGGLSIAASITDTNPTTGWAVDRGGIGRDQAAVFQVEQPVGGAGGSTLTFVLRFGHPNPHHSLGRFRLSVTRAPQPVRLKPAIVKPAGDTWRLGIEPILRGEKPDPKHHQAALAWYAGTLPQWQALKKKLDGQKKVVSGKKRVKVQVSSEGFKPTKHHADGRGFPHFYKQTHILSRGDVKQKGEVAAPSFLRVLMRNEKDESRWQVKAPVDWKRTSYRRTALAGWLTDDQDGAGHLAARVIVNRLWHHHLGRGIVATPNDFGSQGARPSHPDLLDWLARDLVDNGWKLKRLHKLIMTS